MTTSRQLLRDASGRYTPTLVALFYAVFDPTLGPRVVHQIPDGSVATALNAIPSRASSLPRTEQASDEAARESAGDAAEEQKTPVLFDFASILDFVIPKPELCGHLITKATNNCKILGFPTRIVDEEKYGGTNSVYNRNAFVFNVCFVFERDAELSVFEPVVRKTGRTLCAMEEHSSLLSSPPPDFSMANLLEQLYRDLNAYSMTSVPLLGVDLDVGLFPFHMNPPEVRTWDVPVAVIDLERMKTRSWDVTLYKVCSFIDGVNAVKRIAELAEVDLYLARQCIQHLVYYNAVLMVDIFQFSNSYALLPEIADVVCSEEDGDGRAVDLPTECENYVFSGNRDSVPVPFATLLSYYATLQPGLSLAEWIELHSLDAQPIDVRRMIQYGVIKSFLRRVHTYPVWLDHPALQRPRRRDSPPSQSSSLGPRSGSGSGSASRTATPPARPSQMLRNRWLDAPASPHYSTSAQPSRTSTPTRPFADDCGASGGAPRDPRAGGGRDDGGGGEGRGGGHEGDDDEEDMPTAPTISYPPSLALLFDGTHHTDEICLKYACSWRTLELVLRHLGEGGRVGGGDAVADELAAAASEVEDPTERAQAGSRRGSAATALDKAAGGYGERVVVLHI